MANPIGVLFLRGDSVKETPPFTLPFYFVCIFPIRSVIVEDLDKEHSWHLSGEEGPDHFPLFFIDDILLFAKENSTEAYCIMDTLNRYQDSSGQVVNLEK